MENSEGEKLVLESNSFKRKHQPELEFIKGIIVVLKTKLKKAFDGRDIMDIF